MKRNVVVEPDLAAVSFALSQTSRCAILQALMGGVALPASELAYQAGISNSSASAHLKRLVEAGLIRVILTGRHRYYELTNHLVAEIVETLSILAPKRTLAPRKSIKTTGQLRRARLCYDHLAGGLGVAIANSMLSCDQIVRVGDEFDLRPKGVDILRELGVDLEKAYSSRRYFARVCVDWSERQAHIAGALGAVLTNRLFELNWIIRNSEDRSLEITPLGVTQLAKMFHVSPVPIV